MLNRLFAAAEISVREAFTRVGTEGEGIVEQIDGVIELDGEIYLVEMKWLARPVGTLEMSHHLVRIFSRAQARGVLISYSDYTEPAITTCREALSRVVVTLCQLNEIVLLLERKGDLQEFLRNKIRASVIDKEPFKTVF